MKTTIELSDSLFDAAKALAYKNQTTLRALVEEGLRQVLEEAQHKKKAAFKLEDASVSGGEILITDPREWQSLETLHIAGAINKTAKRRV